MDNTKLSNFVNNNTFDKASVLKIIRTLGIIGGSGILLYSISFLSFEILQVLANLILLSSALLLGGSLIGLLFGIPKSQLNSDDKKGISENTNLEEVSDWLTKIIIGFGIAEISNIQSAIVNSSTYLKGVLPNVSEVVLISIIIYFPVFGFISGWLLTRVHLTELFAGLRDKISGSVIVIEQIVKKIRDHAEYHSGQDLAPTLDSSDEINELISNVTFLEKNNYPLKWDTYNKLGLILRSKGNYGLAIQYFDKSYSLTDNPSPLINKAVTYSKELRLPEKAIEISKEILKDFKKDDEVKARTYYNLACTYLRLNKKDEALDALEKSLDLKPKYKSFAVSDSALKQLSENKKFQELVPNYKPETDDHHLPLEID